MYKLFSKKKKLTLYLIRIITKENPESVPLSAPTMIPYSRPELNNLANNETIPVKLISAAFCTRMYLFIRLIIVNYR